MRILQLGKFYPIRGGVEKVMWDLTRGLAGRDIDTDMLCASLDGRQIIKLGNHGRCICVKALCKVAATMISPEMICWLRRHKNDYDIIHVHHPDPMACLALRLSGYKGKVVLHWHSDILKQKGLLKLYMPLQRYLVRRSDTIVGTSPVYVRESPALAEVQGKVTCLPIGISDSIRSRTRPAQGLSDRKMIFSLGRLVEYKGFEYLIEAACHLPDDYEVVIAGEGPEYSRLKKIIGEKALEGKVRILGYVDDATARELFNRCSVFVLSSVLKTEAFGIVQIEAMSCGKPVVATRIPGSGTSWVNADGISGLNVECRNPRAIAAAVQTICRDSKTYEDFCNGARQRFEKMFTIEAMIEGAVRIYGGEGKLAE